MNKALKGRVFFKARPVHNLKKCIAAAVGCLMLFSNMQAAYGATIYYQRTEKEIISKGVVLEKSKLATDKGLLDTYILRVSLMDNKTKVKPAQSTDDFGLKETTTRLLSKTGAIAGVNGDFFDLAGTHSNPVGPVVTDGRLIEANELNNSGTKKFSTLIIGKDGKPLIDYLKTDLEFLNDGVENIKVLGYNKIGDMTSSVYIDRTSMQDTKSIDEKFGVAKIVVENGVIKAIGEPWATVSVPENGYVIVVSGEVTPNIHSIAKVGQKAEFKATASVPFDKIQAAIGGAGRLLSNGYTVVDDGYVPGGDQPRTAVGYNADKTELIMMVVDGRSHSVGVTHDELANLMARAGASDAMHFDGGGSATMAVKKPGEADIRVVNTPSDGAQRKISNALGVYIEGDKGKVSQLVLKPSNTKVFKGTGLPVAVYGTDGYSDINLPIGSFTVTASGNIGQYSNGFFYPTASGKTELNAIYNGLTAQTSLECLDLAAIYPEKTVIKTGIGGSTLLSSSGISKDGVSAYIYTGINYEVVPSSLGHMDGDTFIADNHGVGYIKCYVGAIEAYIDVNVGNKTVTYSPFEGKEPINFASYPEGVTGNSQYKTAQVHGGKSAVMLNYRFSQSTETQAAYTVFEKPIVLTGDPQTIRLWVYGDGSGNWLRARLKDSGGKEMAIDLAKTIDFTGWKQVEGYIPQNVKYPVSLERIYVAAVSSENTAEYTLYFDDLTGDVFEQYEAAKRPQSTIFTDRYRTKLNDKPAPGAFDVTVAGDIMYYGEVAPENYGELQSKAAALLAKGSSLALIAGESDIPEDMPAAKTVKYGGGYSYQTYNDVAVVQLNAAGSGLIAADPSQWEKFTKDLQETQSSHVIILIDTLPLNFRQLKEYELFQWALKDIGNTGKNIFVVASEGMSNYVIVRDGIRYINLGAYLNKDNTINEGFGILRLRINGLDINYDITGQD